MKRIIALLLAIICIMGLCACEKKPSSNISEDEIDDVSRGKVKDDVYKNDSVNITFTKSDDMIFASDEDIAAIMNVSKDLLKDGDKIFKVSKLTSVTDFLAKNPVTGNNVLLVFEDLTKTGNSKISVSQYIEASMSQLKKQTGMSYTFGEESEIKLGEETYTKLTAKVKYSGISMNQGYYFRKIGKYMVVITITVSDKKPLSTYEAMFS